jgi:quaternary ammonium compound-resistance protein SugE
MHIAGPRPWLSLLVSAVFEVVWIVSLKMTNGFARLVPIAVYAVSGLGAAVFLSIALRMIPMATAYAVWMGLSLIGALAVDIAVFREPWNAFRVACSLMIIAGTCGLRWSAAP